MQDTEGSCPARPHEGRYSSPPPDPLVLQLWGFSSFCFLLWKSAYFSHQCVSTFRELLKDEQLGVAPEGTWVMHLLSLILQFQMSSYSIHLSPLAIEF